MKALNIIKNNDLRKEFFNDLISFFENNIGYINSKNIKIWEHTIYDLYDNKMINTLVKKISKLDKKKYSVHFRCMIPKYRKLAYLKINYDIISVIDICTVTFINDKYIDNIHVCYTQINNNEAIVEYKIQFNRVMTSGLFFDFLKHNRKKLYNKDFVDYYYFDSKSSNKEIDMWYVVLLKVYRNLLQAEIGENFLLNFGKNYMLPSCMIKNVPKEEYNKFNFRDVFLRYSCEIRGGEQYLIFDFTSDYGMKMDLYFTGNSYSPIRLITYISEFRMMFYFYIFNNIERIELNIKMNRYFNRKKKRISAKDFKWMVNKKRSIDDNKCLESFRGFRESTLKNIKAFYENEEIEVPFSSKKYIDKYDSIYSECLKHLETLYSLQKENL